ncbi:DUF4920 domain-containing protein [Shewanella psychrotolerans]|uniref:DUF4920 domain-containing protein n=1 Tax=Shewanella psychrotolerans TaxID=2864206 RepID=UPI001C662128|nr:DUF4920 domain-containing protein [Shewanella psychrotolerans]QYK00736.1 DUF4920 domain-containing protein [Shewanella psychrotolerans]
MLSKIIGISLLILASMGSIQAQILTFGTEVNDNHLVNVSTILATPASYVGQQVTIKGMITNVCSKRGCWMTVASDQRFQELFIKVPDGEMVFPISAKGSEAIVTGALKAKPLNLAQTKSWLAEQAKHQGLSFDPDTVTKAISLYELTPVGVKILE